MLLGNYWGWEPRAGCIQEARLRRRKAGAWAGLSLEAAPGHRARAAGFHCKEDAQLHAGGETGFERARRKGKATLK